MNNTIKDFDLDLKTNKKDTATPYVGSRYLCTPGSCWKLVCFITTVK
ncbi:TPA: lantibiotic streptin [Streptococcus pyogenes]|nr:lantibiotic streptin [Streptococcus pyogenes]HEQ0993946.1 lantibiotic streptin [Streptococcus pyogenes]